MASQEDQQNLIDSILIKFENSMSSTMAEVERLLNKYIIENGITQTSALELDVIFEQILQEAGYYDLINQVVDNGYNEIIPAVKDGFKEDGLFPEYTEEAIAIILALKYMAIDNFTNIARTSAKQLRDNAYRYVVADYTVDQLAAQIAKDLDGTRFAQYSNTYARTAVGMFQQTVIDINAQGMDGFWYYSGPDDSATRDFCHCVLSKNSYFNYDTKIKIERDPKRKFNCRHRLRFGTEEYLNKKGLSLMKSISC